MYVTKEKDILVDCDGVLLDWLYHFNKWMQFQGCEFDTSVNPSTYALDEHYGVSHGEINHIIQQFNESAWIGKLTQYKDSIKYVKKLHEEGFKFHVISSMSDDGPAGDLRTRSLKDIFGDVFSSFEYLPCFGSKLKALSKFKNTGCYWIEDDVNNAIDGDMVGLTSLIMSHEYNANYRGELRRVRNWKEIYQIITHEI